METRTQLNAIRKRRGISASQLATLAGVSRQTIYAIEAGDYVPNTAVALQLARLLEVRVEDVFQLKDEPGEQPLRVTADLIESSAARGAGKGQPVRLCRVGPRAVGVPAFPQPAMLPIADGIITGAPKRNRQVEIQIFEEEFEKEKRLLIAGCDPGISLLGQHMARIADTALVIASASSQQALEWLKEGKVHVAGTHLRGGPDGEYNLPVIKRLFPKGGVKVVTFAFWEQGLVLQSGNPKGIHSIADLARPDVAMVNREKGAGSRELLDRKLQEAGLSTDKINGYERILYGHLQAALAVSMGEADCCIATRSAAHAFGLSFVPLATERYDLVVGSQHIRLPAVEALLDVLNRAAVRRNLEALAGYDTSHTGEILIN